MRANEFIIENSQKITLNDLYQRDLPDRDELFWEYVRPRELDTPLTVKTMPSYKLNILLQSQYHVEHLDELLDMMDDDQREILEKYLKDKNIGNKIVVINDDSRIIDGNHRALAAAMNKYSIKYVDTAELEQNDEEVDEGLKDIAAAGIASLGLMGAPHLAIAAPHAAPQKQTHAQVQTKAPTAAAAKTTAKTAAAPTAKAPAKSSAKAPAKATVKTLSKHPERETVVHKAAAKSGMKGAELAQFLAQTKHESWDFGKLKEKGTSDDFKKYDIRYNPDTARILGNTQKGDGEKYRGRGFIQLTGRYNYRKAGEALGLPLEKKPELAARPDIAARIAIWYWIHRVRPNVDNFKDTTAVTKQINPGLLGLRSRKQNFQDYLHLLASK